MTSVWCKMAVKMVMVSVAGCEGRERHNGWQQVRGRNRDISVV